MTTGPLTLRSNGVYVTDMVTMSDLDDKVWREIQMMTAAGWMLYLRHADGVYFTSVPSGSGVSTGVHLILLVITLGFWFPIMVVVELTSSHPKFCRLTFDELGQPQYQPIKRPKI